MNHCLLKAITQQLLRKMQRLKNTGNNGKTLVLQADIAALMSFKLHFDQFSFLEKIKFHIQPSWLVNVNFNLHFWERAKMFLSSSSSPSLHSFTLPPKQPARMGLRSTLNPFTCRIYPPGLRQEVSPPWLREGTGCLRNRPPSHRELYHFDWRFSSCCDMLDYKIA